MSIKATEKERLVNAFLRGESVTDLSAFFAVTRSTIEDVLREAIVQLAQLKVGNLPSTGKTEEQPKRVVDPTVWRKGVVVAHKQRHENYDATHDDPPWIRTVQFEDGTEQTFNWGDLCRDRTFEDNTREGMTIWVNQRGAVSANNKEYSPITPTQIEEEALPHE